jgi:hypothetical protein
MLRKPPSPRQWQVQRDDSSEGDESFPLVHIQHPPQESQVDEHNGQLQGPESIHQHDIQTEPDLAVVASGRDADASHESIARHSDLSASHTPQHGDSDDVPKPLVAGSVTGSRRPSPMWNTKWLHRATLWGFCGLFAAIILTLVLLYHFSQANHGLSTQEQSRHFAWTYGPTALFVLILSGWKQVDFHCQILTPWKNAIEGPTTAERSLFLDYISPLPHSRLWAAFRNRDWVVFASALGVLLLRIVVVFSTGLLVLTPTIMVDNNASLKTNSKFVAKSIAQIVTDDALMEYYGILSHQLVYPYGTTESVAYETIDLSSALPNSTITATVDGFFPHFDCEVSQTTTNFTWYYDSGYHLDRLRMNVTANSSICPPFSGYITEICQPTQAACPSQVSVLDILANSVELQPWYNFNAPLPDSDPCANAWRLVFAQLSYGRNESAPLNSSLGWNVEAGNLSVVMCTLSYSIQSLNITFGVSNANDAVQVRTTNPATRKAKLLDGFSIKDFNQLLGGQFVFNVMQVPVSSYYSGQMRILSLQNGNSSLDAFLNPETFRDTVSSALVGIGAQSASIFLRSPTDKTVTGTVIFEEQRLQVRLLSVCVMSAALLLLIMCAWAILIYGPRNVISRNPNSIATNAAILASSDALNNTFSDAKHLSGEALREHLQRTRIQSRQTSTPLASVFSVDIHTIAEHRIGEPGGSTRKPVIKDTRQRLTWWRPLALSVPFIIWTVLLPVSVIVVLEVLQRVSDTRNGIADVSVVSAPGREAGSLLSSLVLTITAMSYGAIDFAVATLAPYRSLRRGSATSTRSLLKNDVGQLTIASIIRPLRNHHPSIALASLAAATGSWLTIIASGLYTIEPVPLVTRIDVIETDRFINKWNSSTDNTAGSVFTLLEHRNASYPDFTFDEVALPVLQVPPTSPVGQASNNLLQVPLTARRASLNCTVVPQANTTVSTIDVGTPDSGTDWATAVDWLAGVPPSCPIFRNQSNVTITSIPFSFAVQHGNGSNPTLLDLLGGGIVQPDSFGDIQASSIGAPTNGPGCPSLAFSFGLYRFNSTSPENLTAMTCIQGLEEVKVNITFQLPDMTIPTDQPPVVDETSAKWIASEDYTGTLLSYVTFAQYNVSNEDDFYLDGFIQTILFGTEAIPANELIGPSNAERFVQAVQHTYRKYMAQVINLNMREPIENEASRPSYPADILDSTHHVRLIQNNPSKIALQVILGAMALCAVVVYATCFDMRQTLQQSPWSMAGVMSLLAGSELCERRIMPEGAEFMNEQELERVLQGWQFSLGWWETEAPDGQGPPRFGIGVGKEVNREGTAYREGMKG